MRRIGNIGKVALSHSTLVFDWRISGRYIGENKSEFYFLELGNSCTDFLSFLLTILYYTEGGGYSKACFRTFDWLLLKAMALALLREILLCAPLFIFIGFPRPARVPDVRVPCWK